MKKHIALVYIISLLMILPYVVHSGSGSNTILLRNGNIITMSGEDILGGDVLIKGKKIIRIGENISVPKAVKVIELDGRWVMPGIIDSHCHIAVEGNMNETGVLLPAEVHIKDVINPEDYNIFHALAAGVTTVHTMHGSANPIGGRNIVLKLRWGQDAEGLIFKEAPETLKWALGENPKQSRVSNNKRYPNTRMGIEASIRDLFEQAKDYQRKWKIFKKDKSKGLNPIPPRKNYRLEVISDTLKGKYWIRCHAYQGPEMLSIMKLCDEYGVKLAAFEHGLEGYRVANELKKYNVAVTGFVDFWGYKWETFWTIPHNLAYLAKRGVLIAINSDSNTRMRRLYIDAAKTIRFGGLSEKEALAAITINPAIICGIEKYVGSLEPGKHADIAVFNRHPLDPYTRVEMTLVEGKILFDRDQYFADRKKAEKVRKKKEAERKKREREDKEKKKSEAENKPGVK